MKHRQQRPAALSAAVLALMLLGIGAWALRTPQGSAQEGPPLIEYPAFPPTPTIGPQPAAPAAAAGQTILASDFADPAALNSFTVVDLEFVLSRSQSLWVVEEGRLVQAMTAGVRNPSTQQTAAISTASGQDYRVRVSFYDQYNGVVGLIARYSGDDPTTASFYRYRILKDSYAGTPKQVIERVVDGVARSLVELKGPGFREREWHTLEMSVVGGRIEVWLDGALVATADDPEPLGAGRAGLYSRAIGGLLFDDFSVTTP